MFNLCTYCIIFSANPFFSRVNDFSPVIIIRITPFPSIFVQTTTFKLTVLFLFSGEYEPGVLPRALLHRREARPHRLSLGNNNGPGTN